MTLIGKLLVLFNLAFALLLAAWSFEIWANGLDWAGRDNGEFAVREKKLDEMWKGAAPAQTYWLSERSKLTKAEASLVADRTWYDTELRFVFAGPAKPKGGLRGVSIANKDDPKAGVKKAEILLDDQGFPVLVPLLDAKGNPLQLLSMDEYNKEDANTQNELQQVIALHLKQIDEAIQLTDKIVGTPDARGYHERIADERARVDQLQAEIKRVEPMYVNTMVEAQLINKRHAQMLKRIEELKKVKVASK